MTVAQSRVADPLAEEMQAIGRAARAAAAQLALADAGTKAQGLRAAAAEIRAASDAILAGNAADMAAAQSAGTTAAFLDRLRLDAARVEAMAKGLDDIAALPDPVGSTIAEWTRPNGLVISQRRVPMGVVGIIYESRPNVTADAGALCLKAGNAAILRGGSESFHSSGAIAEAIRRGLARAGLPEDAVQRVPTRDRAAVGHLLTMTGLVDVIVPRGGKSLIERVLAEARLPVIAHLEGLCHTYVDGAADRGMARRIVLNAKMRRTGVCGATETLLVDRRVATTHLPAILDDLARAGCALRGDAETQALDVRVTPATDEDWWTEYLDAILSVRIVDGVEGAIRHVNHYGSHHTDAIVTEDAAAAKRFLDAVDSAIVLHNASTQYADGGEFGFGGEIGISTGRLPPRGPVGAEQLTTYKYVVRGSGQTRP